VMNVSVIAIADELASAAELVTGKLGRCPFVVARGYALPGKDGSEGRGSDLLMDASMDLFR